MYCNLFNTYHVGVGAPPTLATFHLYQMTFDINCYNATKPKRGTTATNGDDIMSEQDTSENLNFNPNNLLNTIIERMKLKNDAALSRMLEVAPPVISKIRHGRLPVGASLLIRMHEETGMNIGELRELMGDRRKKYRLSDAQGKPVAASVVSE
jgi:hypothetical protein